MRVVRLRELEFLWEICGATVLFVRKYEHLNSCFTVTNFYLGFLIMSASFLLGTYRCDPHKLTLFKKKNWFTGGNSTNCGGRCRGRQSWGLHGDASLKRPLSWATAVQIVLKGSG